MVGYYSRGDDNSINWTTEDELEIENCTASSVNSLAEPGHVTGNPEASSSSGPFNSKLTDHFVAMGFAEKLVAKAIQENGEEDTDTILNTLLTYSALENSPVVEQPQCSQQPIKFEQCLQQPVDSEQFSSDDYDSFLDDLSDMDSFSDNEVTAKSVPEEENKLLRLADMGYSLEEASTAVERCGSDASIEDLTDFLCAAQMAKEADALLPPEPEPRPNQLLRDKHNKRKLTGYESCKRNKQKRSYKDDDLIRIPKPMIGFGVPNEPCLEVSRSLPEAAIGPPFFYYENVALAPRGVWNTISRFLYDIEPEFVDSKYFGAAARKRGYVHNLPIHGRFPLLPLPAQTIFDAFPLTRKWWPTWDTRSKLNCLQTSIGTARSTDKIRKALERYDGDPPLHVQKSILDECRRWNLVWVGRNKVAPLEPDEVEMLLGFPKNHTRGGGISRTDRYKSLGNSFQVDTVAYHFSVLKNIFPDGLNLLSLFSGIGGAEVALHQLGIPLKNVVSVEISEVNSNIVRSWWEQTNQKGNLIHISDIQQLNGDRLEQLMQSFGGFDLIVGGSPCNNLSGNNRVSRDGLEGKDSILFYDFFRILDLVKCIASKDS